MKIAIVGAGNVGGALGSRWAKNGHKIIFGVRDPGSRPVRELLNKIGGKSRAAQINEAIEEAPVIAVTLPWVATEETLRCTSVSWDQKIIIDATNPVLLGSQDLQKGLLVGHTTSAAEQIASWTPGSKVVKAFNTTGAANMRNPVYGNEKISMFICGNHPDAKEAVKGLVSELDFDVVDVGRLEMARYLEPAGMLWIAMAMFAGFGTEFGFRVIRRVTTIAEK